VAPAAKRGGWALGTGLALLVVAKAKATRRWKWAS
jgi:hypothetical protein